MRKEFGFVAMFRALGYRNFRLFFAGQGVSLIGTWMQAIAMSWLVYRLTNSVFLLGVVGFASQAPAFLLTPFTGVIADRWNRRRTLVVTQTLSMIQALALAVLTMTGTIEVWHIIVLGIMLGCINALDIPVRQSFVVEMVEKKEVLGNAIALNSLMFNSARLIGPSIAGLLIALVGESVCFFINGISFLAVIVSLSIMHIKPRSRKIERPSMLKGLKEGFSYVFGSMPIKMILSLLSVISVMGTSYVVVMPAFARDVLKGGAYTLGFLMASAGVGALAATLYLASRKSVLGLGALIPIASSIFSIGLVLFSVSRSLWLSMILLAFAGFGMMAHMAASNTILQTIVDDDLRGRVMSFYTMAFIGTAPFGSLLAGSLAKMIGVTNTIILGGTVCLAASALFAARLPLLAKMIHPIYRKIGVIGEVAQGIGTATGLTLPPED